jgi:hypothetical protein
MHYKSSVDFYLLQVLKKEVSSNSRMYLIVLPSIDTDGSTGMEEQEAVISSVAIASFPLFEIPIDEVLRSISDRCANCQQESNQLSRKNGPAQI